VKCVARLTNMASSTGKAGYSIPSYSSSRQVRRLPETASRVETGQRKILRHTILTNMWAFNRYSCIFVFAATACGAGGVGWRLDERSGGLGEWYLLRWRPWFSGIQS
jgi:hypothetical protein